MIKEPDLYLSSIPAEERSEALRKFEIIKPFLEDSIPLAQISRSTNIARRTLWRWVTSYKEGGLLGLVRQKRTSNKSSIPDEMHELIEGLAVIFRRSVQQLSEVLFSNLSETSLYERLTKKFS